MKNPRKTRKRKRLAVVMTAICLALSPVLAVAAANTPTPVISPNHRMTGGIGNIYVYIDDKEPLKATYWQNLIKTAINNWVYTGVGANKFYCLGYVSSGVSGSKIDWYARSSGYWGNDGVSVLAETKFYDYGLNRVNPVNSDWYSGEINLNDPLLRQDRFSNDVCIGTFTHEMGHAFGLAHNNTNQDSVMCQTAYNRRVQRVQKVDNDALNSLY
mgnify:FL=1